MVTLDLYNVLDLKITEKDSATGRKPMTLVINHTTHKTEITLFPDLAEDSVAIHDERDSQ